VIAIKPISPRDKTKQFFSNYHERNYGKGQILVFAGDTNKDVYYLVAGRIKKYSVNYKGEEVVMTIFRPGSFVPISQSIGQKTSNRFHYAADTDITVRVAPSSDVINMLLKNPDIMMSLLLRVNRGLDEFLGRSLSLMAGSALSRVCYEIYIEATRFGIKEEGNNIFIEINERSIAARTGLTRETVNREIRKLKNIDAVGVERRGLVIKNLPLLEKKLYKELL
ncbi:MAG: Crp/Fnr family transcriptional regulator, partial [Bdellovibrionales bacterium]